MPKDTWVFFYSVLLATTIVATAVITAVSAAIAATAATEDDEDKDDYPAAIISAEVTHLRNPLFVFSTHTMNKKGNVLQRKLIFFLYNLMLISPDERYSLSPVLYSTNNRQSSSSSNAFAGSEISFFITFISFPKKKERFL